MRDQFRTVGLYVNAHKPPPVEAAARLIPWLRERGVQPIFEVSVAQWLRGETGAPISEVLAADLVVVLGGDGTVLSAARDLASCDAPMLTVRFGSFGFMAEVEPDAIEPALERVLAGDFSVEERPMLRVVRVSEGEKTHDVVAMNDVAVVRAASPRLAKLDAAVDGEPLATYSGDGVVVSTATGSTAYSLAAGGPIVHPTVSALLLTPICPHALHFRPLLLPAEASLSLRIPDMGGEAQASVDGQITFPVLFGDTLTISRAACKARFITLGASSFYSKVRTRLRWGERLL
ncbi:MAG TPA: NAD(+)/NADH kinase [Armatimonadota bacterium]|jgi:NAD+ kinase